MAFLLKRRATLNSLASLSWAGSLIPVSDLRGSKYSESERIVRNKLASLYRLIDWYGWSDGIYGHSSVRVPNTDNEFLINPLGLLCHEITASSLVKVNIDGDVIDPGSTSFGINKAGYFLHSSIYDSRPDVNCISHIHTTSGAAVSCMKCGLLPISQDALTLGKVTYHSFRGFVSGNEKEELQRDLGSTSTAMILNNHGLAALGSTVDEAFFVLRLLVVACDFQVGAIAAGLENVIMPDVDHMTVFGDEPSDETWARGELEWEAEMRKLDMHGCNTGQVYRTASFIHFPYAANQLQEGKSSLTAESLISMSKNEQ
ncbi:alpha-adducin-like isoform X2 [Corticium candelabrum]|uniref:alpha-adducin-like isoform X2 n=1 Tax=Corticium candelabrum TaxID=121492 RepID=UPI002E26E54E|nr:alpha-adducin-like isoform X2 [Corticium candelabrum]